MAMNVFTGAEVLDIITSFLREMEGTLSQCSVQLDLPLMSQTHRKESVPLTDRCIPGTLLELKHRD